MYRRSRQAGPDAARTRVAAAGELSGCRGLQPIRGALSARELPKLRHWWRRPLQSRHGGAGSRGARGAGAGAAQRQGRHPKALQGAASVLQALATATPATGCRQQVHMCKIRFGFDNTEWLQYRCFLLAYSAHSDGTCWLMRRRYASTGESAAADGPAATRSDVETMGYGCCSNRSVEGSLLASTSWTMR